jgi:methyltransferase (TIGR00027 family)
MADARIENVSDTARWVALYRAIESDRPDAHFRDPYARPLAGSRGAEIARTLPGFRSGVWPMVVRTCVIDELVLRAIERDGADTVVNLASGLDARPWRLKLPAGLRWFDVDLPAMLAYKRDALARERPACALESVAADLTRAEERRALFTRIGAGSRRAVVISEGLLVYLADGEVRALASDLHAVESFRWWIVDLVAPRLLKMLNRRWGASLEARASLRFAPSEGTRFFEPFGWKELEFRSTLEEAVRLKRTPPQAWLWRLMGRLMPAEKREEMRRMGGIALLGRNG